jgi:hypothetical protein
MAPHFSDEFIGILLLNTDQVPTPSREGQLRQSLSQAKAVAILDEFHRVALSQAEALSNSPRQGDTPFTGKCCARHRRSSHRQGQIPR